MRITGGGARGISLLTAKGSGVRPATDRLRESVFSSLGSFVQNAQFIDLFAGSGAYGLEAWSRGAVGGYFVEKDRNSLRFLKQNIASVARSLGQSPDSLRVVQSDVERWQMQEKGFADLIFVDPPYSGIESIATELFPRFLEWLAPGGRIVFEMPGYIELQPSGWEQIRRLGKGRHQPTCRIFQRASDFKKLG